MAIDILPQREIEGNFERLKTLVQAYGSKPLCEMMDSLEGERPAQDLDRGTVNYLGLLNAPAAKGNHHAYLGGLVAHYLEMWQFGCIMLPQFQHKSKYFTEERILKGIMLHDLHKAWETFVVVANAEKGTTTLEYGKSPSSALMTNNQKTVHLVHLHEIPMDEMDWNILHSSEGGWAEAMPKDIAAISKFIYLLDELSGNVFARIEQGNEIFLRHKSPVPGY